MGFQVTISGTLSTQNVGEFRGATVGRFYAGPSTSQNALQLLDKLLLEIKYFLWLYPVSCIQFSAFLECHSFFPFGGSNREQSLQHSVRPHAASRRLRDHAERLDLKIRDLLE